MFFFSPEYIQPVCLPPQGQNYTVGKKCFIAGWGRDTDREAEINDQGDKHLHVPVK